MTSTREIPVIRQKKHVDCLHYTRTPYGALSYQIGHSHLIQKVTTTISLYYENCYANYKRTTRMLFILIIPGACVS